MENYRDSERTSSFASYVRGRGRHANSTEDDTTRPPSRTNSLAVGAKTVAGVGIGLLAVVAGSAIIGVAAETVLVPSILLKLAGGIAGGGMGMAKGLKDAQKD